MAGNAEAFETSSEEGSQEGELQEDFATSDDEEEDRGQDLEEEPWYEKARPLGSGAYSFAEWLVSRPGAQLAMRAREVRVFSFCSGMGTDVIAGDAVAVSLRERGVAMKLTHTAVCENNIAKQEFLQRHFPKVESHFHDVCQMSSRLVKDLACQSQFQSSLVSMVGR